MEILFLADKEQHLPTIAQWYYEEWNDLMGDKTLEDEIDYLRNYLNNDQIPLMLIGVEGDRLVGAIQLKRHEMTIYPQKEYWLGGVYINQQDRGRGLAAQLVKKGIEIATSIGIEQLHLQTEDLTGGLYATLGWEPIEQVNYKNEEVLVMELLIQ